MSQNFRLTFDCELENIPSKPEVGIRGDGGMIHFKTDDLDILVKKADLERGCELLSRLNYTSSSAHDYYRTHHHHLAPMFHPEKSVVVELHWNVSMRINVDIDAWWNRSVL